MEAQVIDCSAWVVTSSVPVCLALQGVTDSNIQLRMEIVNEMRPTWAAQSYFPTYWIVYLCSYFEPERCLSMQQAAAVSPGCLAVTASLVLSSPL